MVVAAHILATTPVVAPGERDSQRGGREPMPHSMLELAAAAEEPRVSPLDRSKL